MSKNANGAVRLYKIADSALKQLADDLKDSIVRDSVDFATRGVDAAKITELSNLISDFDNTTTDEELRGFVTTAVEEKNQIRATLLKEIGAVRSRAENKFGAGSGKYNSFGFGELSGLTDDELYRTAKRVVRIGTTLLAELASEGLTQSILDSITTINNNFDLAIDKVASNIENRDLETQNRIEKGNKLYARLVKDAASGKNLFEGTNAAKYNDYVLIGSQLETEEPSDNNNPTP